ncbi:hypothetical protein [Streptomyces sp. NPDC050560]|uniref:hypothetical protein n=1 Tax=Streptomyces sp. NPDC050560 TaxID=3365630 RepID=UPI00379FF587
MTTHDDRPSLVLHAPAGDLEAAAALEFTAAHLPEFRRAHDDRGAAAALVIGEPRRSAELAAAGVPTVYLHPAGAAPGDPGTSGVSASIVCWQMPSWLSGTGPRGGQVGGTELSVTAVGPHRRPRPAGGGGPAVQLTGGAPERERTVRALRSALREAGQNPGPVPVLTGMAADDWDRWAAELGEFDLVRADLADWPRILGRADMLVADPTVLAATLAQTARLPLRLLPGSGARQSHVRGAIAALAGGAGADEAVTVAPDAWPTAEGRAGALGGGAQIARQIRQLCLAPV